MIYKQRNWKQFFIATWLKISSGKEENKNVKKTDKKDFSCYAVCADISSCRKS